MVNDRNKSEKGQFFTIGNPFLNPAFIKWLEPLKKLKFIEPFAGTNNIVNMLPGLQWVSFDIEPGNTNVVKRDTLTNFPGGYDVCITNPPYLAKNSAKRMKLSFPKTKFEDLYQYALDICLKNCRFVAAIIPESFITSGVLQDRLLGIISITFKMFNDTDCPVCLALFDDNQHRDFDIWHNFDFVGSYETLLQFYPKDVSEDINLKIKFNDPYGPIGLQAVDNQIQPSIMFFPGKDISPDSIKVSSRSITRISINKDLLANDYLEIFSIANRLIGQFRKQTHDVFLTSFKGVRKDGMYRRRLDFALAKSFLSQVIKEYVNGI